METESIMQILLIFTALLMLLYIVKAFTGTASKDEEEYSGSARSPEVLYEPSDEAISEMESLISKLN